MRGELAFPMLIDACERATAAGDHAAAAVVLADAATMGGRAPGTFLDPPSHEALKALVVRAAALAPDGDLTASVHVTIAAAWNGRPGSTEPDPVLADRALALARQLEDPVLISNALDAVAAAASSEGRHTRAWRVTTERIDLLDQMPRHDPRVGGEVADSYHMATEGAMAAGELEAALAAAHLAHDDSAAQGLTHFAATHLVVPLALRGDFDDAIAQAEVMRSGWERTGRPAAGWMAPAFYATALVHGVRGEAEASQRWWDRAESIAMQQQMNSFGMFAGPRLALHRGDLDQAQRATLVEGEPLCGSYRDYAVATAAEVAVVAGAPDADAQLEAAADRAAESHIVAAYLLRAAGRRHDDEDELLRSLALWETAGARFERACTMLLLPDRRTEGAAELAALGCPLPPG